MKQFTNNISSKPVINSSKDSNGFINNSNSNIPYNTGSSKYYRNDSLNRKKKVPNSNASYNNDIYIQNPEKENTIYQQKQQINELRNQIALMKRENESLKKTNKYLINNKSKNKNNNYNKSNNKINKRAFNDYDDYKNYENKVLAQMANHEIYDEVGATKDILGEFVDKVLERSLYLYKNRNCHTCARLLAMGKSTTQCPKCHHLYKYPMNSRTNIK